MTQNERHLLEAFEDELYCMRLGLLASSKTLLDNLEKAEKTRKALYKALEERQKYSKMPDKILEFRPLSDGKNCVTASPK
jgi:hypothetical protein